MVMSVYMVMLLSFLMIGFFINYAALKTMPAGRAQYRVVLALAASLPARHAALARVQAALARLRGRPVDDAEVLRELDEMRRQIEDKNLLLASTSTWTIFRGGDGVDVPPALPDGTGPAASRAPVSHRLHGRVKGVG